MQSSIWGFLFLILGILGIVLINLFGNITVDNEDMYYILKEVTEAAMIDAIDYQAYRVGVGYDGVTEDTDPDSMHCIAGVPGTIRIVEEKFIESFTRRFVESARGNTSYKISFDDIDECPPKATITLTARESYSLLGRILKNGKRINYETDSAEIINTLSAILEYRPEDSNKK